MSESEIGLTRQRFHARLKTILTPDELAVYDAYHDRIRAALARHDPDPIATTPAEQALLDRIAADTQAAALDRQLFALLRVVQLPQ